MPPADKDRVEQIATRVHDLGNKMNARLLSIDTTLVAISAKVEDSLELSMKNHILLNGKQDDPLDGGIKGELMLLRKWHQSSQFVGRSLLNALLCGVVAGLVANFVAILRVAERLSSK